jgi:hypothetical protein
MHPSCLGSHDGITPVPQPREQRPVKTLPLASFSSRVTPLPRHFGQDFVPAGGSLDEISANSQTWAQTLPSGPWTSSTPP